MSGHRVLNIRWMIRSDMPDVKRIESLTPDPWTEDRIIHTLRDRDVIGMVIESADQRIVGYMMYGLGKTYIRLIRIAVNAADRRRGYGRAMIEKVKGKLSRRKRWILTCDVPEDLVGCQLFMRACGLCAESCVDGYYCFVVRAGQK